MPCGLRPRTRRRGPGVLLGIGWQGALGALGARTAIQLERELVALFGAPVATLSARVSVGLVTSPRRPPGPLPLLALLVLARRLGRLLALLARRLGKLGPGIKIVLATCCRATGCILV